MFDNELESVLAKRELVNDVTIEKIRDGIVDTPEMLDEELSAGRDRIKICSEHQLKDRSPARGDTCLEDLNEV